MSGVDWTSTCCQILDGELKPSKNENNYNKSNIKTIKPNKGLSATAQPQTNQIKQKQQPNKYSLLIPKTDPNDGDYTPHFWAPLLWLGASPPPSPAW